MFWPSNYIPSFDGDRHWEVLANAARVSVQKWRGCWFYFPLESTGNKWTTGFQKNSLFSWLCSAWAEKKKMLLKYIPRARSLKTGCEVFSTHNHKHNLDQSWSKQLPLFWLMLYRFFGIILIISNGTSVLLSILLPSWCCPNNRYFHSNHCLIVEANDWIRGGSPLWTGSVLQTTTHLYIWQTGKTPTLQREILLGQSIAKITYPYTTLIQNPVSWALTYNHQYEGLCLFCYTTFK